MSRNVIYCTSWGFGPAQGEAQLARMHPKVRGAHVVSMDAAPEGSDPLEFVLDESAQRPLTIVELGSTPADWTLMQRLHGALELTPQSTGGVEFVPMTFGWEDRQYLEGLEAKATATLTDGGLWPSAADRRWTLGEIMLALEHVMRGTHTLETAKLAVYTKPMAMLSEGSIRVDLGPWQPKLSITIAPPIR